MSDGPDDFAPPPRPVAGGAGQQGLQPQGPLALPQLLTDGPTGQQRSTGRCILLFFVTFSVYGYIYNYKVHAEMKRHSGRGVGGGIALLLTFIAGIAMPFVTPAEVGALYARKGQPEPVRGWTGLWFIGPALAGYLIVFGTSLLVIATAKPTTAANGSPGAGAPSALLVVSFLLYVVITLFGAVTWFIKTNGALNQYWRWTSSAPA